MNVPPHLKELLVKVITVLLRKIDVPQDEIDVLVERIDERGVSEMLAIENYSVQATRREADRQRAEADQQRAEAVQQRTEAVQQLKSAVKALLEKGSTVTEIASILNTTEESVTSLLPELSPA